MAYQDDLPTLFAELPNLVIAGFATPQDLGQIMMTGGLPQGGQPPPTLADLEGQFRQQPDDIYTTALMGTGDPRMAAMMAGSAANEAINAAIEETMVKNLAETENKLGLATEAAMSYQGAIPAEVDMAGILSRVYGVPSRKLNDALEKKGRQMAEPFYENPELRFGGGKAPDVDMQVALPDAMAGPGVDEARDLERLDALPWMVAGEEEVAAEAAAQAELTVPPPPSIGPAGPIVPTVTPTPVPPPGVVPLAPPPPEVPAPVPGPTPPPWMIEGEMATYPDALAPTPTPVPPPGVAPLAPPPPGALAPVPGPTPTPTPENQAVVDGLVEDKIEELKATALAMAAQSGLDWQAGASGQVADYLIAQLRAILESPPGVLSSYKNADAGGMINRWFAEVPSPDVPAQVAAAAVPGGPLQGGTLLDPKVQAEAEKIFEVLNGMGTTDYMLVGGSRESTVVPEGEFLFVGPNKNLWGVREVIRDHPEVISYGPMEKGVTAANQTSYVIQGYTLENEPKSAQPWRMASAQPPAALAAEGGPGIAPVAAPWETGSPVKQWEALRAQEMGEDIWNPVRWGTRMHGFEPAYGQFLLSGKPAGSFYEFAQSGAQIDPAQRFQELAQASAGLASPISLFGVDPQEREAIVRQIRYHGLLQGEQARDKTILAAAAGLGAGRGEGGQAVREQLARMYDVFAAQAAAGGQPAGGFINWLNQRMVPGSIEAAHQLPAAAPWMSEQEAAGMAIMGP